MRIIDKNKDYYDWLSHTEISDDSILFDRRNSEFLTKSGFCAEVQLKGIVEYDIDIERRGKSWKSYRHERSGAHYEIALVAGTNLFIMRLDDLVHNEGFDENGRRREILSDFTPTVVCARKNYGWNGVPLGLFTLKPKWWNRRTRRMVSAWDANGAESWDNANLAKALLYAINGGKDEAICKGQQIGPEYPPITSEYLDYDELVHKFDLYLDWLARLYVNTLNLIHYMHDKYYYEAAEMALIDTDVRRTFATGIAGFSHVVDSLCAVKYAKVKVIRDKETGLAQDFQIEGDFPRYGNDDDRADDIAVWLLKTFMAKIKHNPTYRHSEPTTSILTITSNVVYGKATGTLPDGRKAGEPLSPGANPSYGAEKHGLLASLNSAAKIPYDYALDGISITQTINPAALGHDDAERTEKLMQVLDGYFSTGSHHLNVNVFGVEKLKDAMEHPEKEEYQNFTIRVSGYAVRFIKLTREQQLDVIARQAHGVL